MSYAASLHETFAAHARRAPAAVALRDGGATVTYSGLDALSRDVAAALLAAGVRRGELVGLVTGRGIPAVAGVLGILLAGCAYVPVDPAYPAARQDFLLENSRVRLVVADDGGPVVRRRSPAGPRHEVPDGTAYVIYTSGSTGLPKGVVVGHRQVLALFAAAAPVFAPGQADVWSLFHSHSFDFSVWEMWGALLHGGRAVVVPDRATYEPDRLLGLLTDEGVTVLSQVPTPFRYLTAAARGARTALPALRHVVLGGEAADPAVVAEWHDRAVAPRSRVSNMYGITETTVHVTHTFLTGTEPVPREGGTPIGVPLRHLDVALVDHDLNPVPAGEPGEVLVSGAGLAHGYLGNQALTAQRFPGGRAYRSGDWAVRDERGALFHLGRRDEQVQVRGYRIELGEVAAAVRTHPAVNACVVTAPERDGVRALVAHVQLAAGVWADSAALRGHAARTLPVHMVPARYVVHDAFPLTASGKVDRAALDVAASRR